MNDGQNVYQCTSPDDFQDVLAGGKAACGIEYGWLDWTITPAAAEIPPEVTGPEDPG